MPLYPPASSGSGAPTTATYLTQVADGTLSAEQAMGALATGLVKNTTTTGVQSIAVAGTDYASPMTYTAGGADAGQTMATNTIYYVDISGYTADRTYTLPAVAAIGESVGIIVTTGDNAFELLITAASGDTLNGVAGGTEWSRLFISSEYVQIRCVVANATWVVVQDGRIPVKSWMQVSTASDGETAATYTTLTAAATPGVWTTAIDVGDVLTTSTSILTARRAGRLFLSAGMVNKDSGTAGNYVGVRIIVGASTEVASGSTSITGGLSTGRVGCERLIDVAVDDAFTHQYRTQAGALGVNIGSASYFGCVEIL